jgi:hypothetical protein
MSSACLAAPVTNTAARSSACLAAAATHHRASSPEAGICTSCTRAGACAERLLAAPPLCLGSTKVPRPIRLNVQGRPAPRSLSMWETAVVAAGLWAGATGLQPLVWHRVPGLWPRLAAA